jgi:HhH-GPD superfamily base excision DNA repair protein
MSLPFDALVRAITYQQMSDAAAAKTYKGLQRCLETALTPERVLALPHDMMRAVGLSKSKARYVQNLAEWFNANSGRAKNLPAMSNDEVIKALTDIAGIGVWTANVFCYSICRGSTSCRPPILEFVAVFSWPMGSRASPRLSWFTKRLCVGSRTEALLLFTYGMQLSSR